MNSVAISAPAKINLMLDVVGKRPDCFHDLITVMQSVSLCDRVTAAKNGGGITVSCTAAQEENIPADERNTAYRAAAEFFGYTKAAGGVTVSIEKKIPSKAGLGGGSADAAAVIVGLDRLFGTRLTEAALCEIGLRVGADVPFCIVGGTKLCRGVGEEMCPAPELEDCVILLAKGADGISTKDAYKKIDAAPRVTTPAAELFDGTVRSLGRSGGNVFEQVCSCRDVFRIKEFILSHGGEYAALTGSGSAVFGLFHDPEQAGCCALLLRSKSFWCRTCRPLGHGAEILPEPIRKKPSGA